MFCGSIFMPDPGSGREPGRQVLRERVELGTVGETDTKARLDPESLIDQLGTSDDPANGLVANRVSFTVVEIPHYDIVVIYHLDPLRGFVVRQRDATEHGCAVAEKGKKKGAPKGAPCLADAGSQLPYVLTTARRASSNRP